jgi:anti-anti-sigma factor
MVVSAKLYDAGTVGRFEVVMSFQVNVQHANGVAVVSCAGRIVRGEATQSLKKAVTSQCDARVVVLDLSDVEIVDGGGLGVLVYLRRWTQENGIQMKLVNPSPFVYELLDRTHLTRVFEISSIAQALAILGCEHVRNQEYAVVQRAVRLSIS